MDLTIGSRSLHNNYQDIIKNKIKLILTRKLDSDDERIREKLRRKRSLRQQLERNRDDSSQENATCLPKQLDN